MTIDSTDMTVQMAMIVGHCDSASTLGEAFSTQPMAAAVVSSFVVFLVA